MAVELASCDVRVVDVHDGTRTTSSHLCCCKENVKDPMFTVSVGKSAHLQDDWAPT